MPNEEPRNGGEWHGDLRDARVIARNELRAMWRRVSSDRRQLLGVGLGLLQFAVVFPLFAYVPATDLGGRIATGAPPLGVLGMLCGASALTGIYMGGASAINQNRIGTVGPLIRTSVPPRAVTLGRIGSELLQTGVLFVPPVLVALIEVGIGAGGPLVPLLLGVAVLAILAAGVFVGRVLGSALRYLGVLSRLGTWAKVVVFLTVMALIFLGTQMAIQAFLPDAPFGVSASVPPLLPGRPLQAYAAVLLSPVGGTVSAVGALAVLAVFAAIPGGFALAARIETALLLDDRADETDDTVTSRGVPSVFARRRSTRIGWRHLLRTVRDPKSVAHAFPLVAGIVPGSMFLLTDPGIVTTIGPPLAVGFGAIAGGLLYGLNPLGDDRDQLPLVLTSVESTAPLLRGRIVACSAIGLAIGGGSGLALAPFGPEPVASLAIVAVAPVLVAAAAGVALGLGAFSPQFERNEYMNVKRAHPSQTVLMGYMMGGGLVFVGGAFGLWLTLSATLEGKLSATIAAGVWLVGLAVMAALGYAGYRYAVGRFEDLTLDDV